jgi:hypothetical protein
LFRYCTITAYYIGQENLQPAPNHIKKGERKKTENTNEIMKRKKKYGKEKKEKE